MPLRVLDGNQTATTLSSVVTGGEHIVAHTVVSLGSTAISNITSAVSGSVVSVSNFPSTQTISGTVTANVANSVTIGSIVGPIGGSVFKGSSASADSIRALPYFSQTGAANYNELSTSNPFPVAGTVTVGGFSSVSVGSGAILIAGDRNGSITPIPIDSGSGQVGVQLKQSSGPTIDPISQTNGLWVRQANNSTITIGNSITISSLPAISGTVTVGNSVTVSALPSGALTTRFGSVTTANTAQITSAVTNTSRKYLLAQNISTGSVTIGIGFSPTTTQGIQLTAGAGLTFDAFCPTGAVYWLGAVTGAAFTILEG